MHKYLLFYILILFSSNILAQDRFLKCEIVSNNNETIQGEVLFKDWTLSPKFIQFKDINGQEIKIMAKDLKSFFVSEYSLLYKSYKCPIKYYNKFAVPLDSSAVTHIDSTYTFYKILVENPKIVLAKLIDENYYPRFYIVKDEKIRELENYKYTKYKPTGSKHAFKFEKYKTQIKYFCQDQAHMAKIDIPMYEEESIKKYILAYCNEVNKDNAKEFTSVKEEKQLRIGLIGGYKQNITNEKVNNISFGVSTMLHFPRNHKNRYFKMNLDYNPKTYIQLTKFSGYSQKIPINVPASLARLEILGGVFIGNTRFQPILSGGVRFYSTSKIKDSIQSKRYMSAYPIFKVGFGFKKILTLEYSKGFLFNNRFDDQNQINLTFYFQKVKQ